MTDLIDRQEAIDALWKALYEYEDKTEKQFKESDELDVGDWILHRVFVQNMSDIDRRAILDLPSAQPEKVCIAKVTLSEEQIREAVEKAKNEIVQVLPSAQPEQRWIPVSERLPEELESVLAYDGTDMFVAWYFNKKWSSHDSQLERDTPIIAWMPLLEPYEAESEDEDETAK